MVMERFPVSGVFVYQLDICAAFGDHAKCPGMDVLSVGLREIGTVACSCSCHKKPEAEIIELPKRDE